MRLLRGKNVTWFRQNMRSVPGFGRLRLHSKGGKPVAFVEFKDVKAASGAMSALQGSFLLSSDRGAIRIEYAKTKMSEVQAQYINHVI